MKPRVGSYGDTATVTRSPSTTRMRCRRTLPASFARTSWPLSSLTRKLPPFAIKMTSPSRWTSSSLLTGPLEALWLALCGAQEKRSGAKGDLPLPRGSPAASRHERRDRPLYKDVLLAASVERGRPGPRVRRGASVLAVEPAPGRRGRRPGSRGVRVLGGPAPRLHAAGPPAGPGAE